jgi:hypothetical protein
MTNSIQHGSYIRNGNGFTFQVILDEKQPTKTFLKPIDHEGSIKTLDTTSFQGLVRMKNYVSVTNPNSVTERYIGKQIGSERFLVK